MKKRNAAALLTAAVVLALPVSQAMHATAAINPDLARNLQTWLLGREPSAEEGIDDMNGDGIVNAIDLTLLKRTILNSGAPMPPVTMSVSATEENVKQIGRTLEKDGITWLVQSGSAVEFTVTGTEASVTIAGDGCVYSDEKWRPRYGVFVDGELLTDVVMGEAEQKVSLFSGETERTATVKVIHLSEANNGAIGVKDITVKTGALHPVQPTAKRDLQIEFIGDSITCAYGVEADTQYVSFETGTENFTKSYAYLAAEMLDADYSAVSYSGYGIISGYSNDGAANTDSLVPDYYSLVGRPSDYAVAWDFDSHPNDVVVINLGTNDSSYCAKEIDTRGPEYQAGYEAFLKTVREKNPDAYIICTLGIMGATELYPYLEAAVTAFGDAKTSCYQSPTHTQADGMGADWHPSPLTHQKNAYLIADQICTAIGREWSKIGLDMAADGEYGVDINKEAGANASIYFSDWDKSLWINTVTGGSDPADITAYVRGLSLPAGDYELSFRTTPPEGMTVTYAVRNASDPKKIYCSGAMEDNGAEQTILQAFTMENADADCEIVFFVGGKDSTTITLHEVTLYKTK